jgi:hypothetical protein
MRKYRKATKEEWEQIIDHVESTYLVSGGDLDNLLNLIHGAALHKHGTEEFRDETNFNDAKEEIDRIQEVIKSSSIGKTKEINFLFEGYSVLRELKDKKFEGYIKINFNE